MFDIGWPEMLVVAIVLIVVVGPKDLPGMLRNFGRTTTKLRSMAGDFRKQFDDALKEAELDDVKGMIEDVRKLNPTNDLKKALNPMQKVAADIRAGLDEAIKPTAKKQDEKDAAQGSVSASTNATPAPPLKNRSGETPLTAAPVKTANATGAGKKAAAPRKTTKAAAPKTAAAKPVAKPAAAKPKTAAKPSAAKSTKASGSGKKSGQTR